jgi:hypothetical protein
MERTILTFILFFGILVAKSQSSITINISSDSVLMGEIIEVKYILDNIETEFQLPDLSDFTVVSGPSISQSMSIINGKKSQKAMYTLYIMMREEGTFYLPGFSVEGGENILEVPALPIKVSESTENAGGLTNKIARHRQLSFTVNSEEQLMKVEQKPKTIRKLKKL